MSSSYLESMFNDLLTDLAILLKGENPECLQAMRKVVRKYKAECPELFTITEQQVADGVAAAEKPGPPNGAMANDPLTRPTQAAEFFREKLKPLLTAMMEEHDRLGCGEVELDLSFDVDKDLVLINGEYRNRLHFHFKRTKPSPTPDRR